MGQILYHNSIRVLEAAMRQVTYQNKLPGTRIAHSGSMLCQPFERNKRKLSPRRTDTRSWTGTGLKIQDACSGGASDANTTSVMALF